MLCATGNRLTGFQDESSLNGLPGAVGELAIHADFQMNIAMGGLAGGTV